MLNTPIAKLIKYDYRMDGTEQIVCVTTDGAVRGYTLQSSKASKGENVGVSNVDNMNEIYNDLLNKKNVNNFVIFSGIDTFFLGIEFRIQFNLRKPKSLFKTQR